MKRNLLALSIMVCAGNAIADTVVQMYVIDEKGIGSSVGQISIAESKDGMVFSSSLKGLPPGWHGFHLHQNPSCAPMEKDGKMVPGLAAGGHYDRNDSMSHMTPWGDGHLGDLPALFVDAGGNAKQSILAPQLKAADIPGRALMVHELSDGGARIACGVIKQTANSSLEEGKNNDY